MQDAKIITRPVVLLALISAWFGEPHAARAADDATIKVIAAGPKGRRIAVRRETPVIAEAEEAEVMDEDLELDEVPAHPISIDIVSCGEQRVEKTFTITQVGKADSRSRRRNWRKTKRWLDRNRFNMLVEPDGWHPETPMTLEGGRLTWVLPEELWPPSSDLAQIFIKHRRAEPFRLFLGHHPEGAHDLSEQLILTRKVGVSTFDRCSAGTTESGGCLFVVCTTVNGAIGNQDTLFTLAPNWGRAPRR